MSARVQRESVGQPVVCEMPEETEVARPQAPRVCKPTVDDIERFRATENDARAGMLGTMMERELRAAFAGMPDGARAELEIAAAVKNGKGRAGDARGTVAVERKGHEYLVTLEASAAVGLGKKGETLSASLMGSLEGKVTLRFGSHEEAADRVTALAQTAAMAGGGLMAVAASVLKERDAVSRSLQAMNRVASVELSPGIVGELKLQMPVHPAVKPSFEAKGTLAPESVRLDLEKGEVVFSASVSRGVSGSAGLELVPKTASLKSSLAEVKVKEELALRASYPLSREDVGRILRDPRELQRISADPSRQTTWTAEATASGHVLGVEFKARRSGPPEEMLEAYSKGDLLGWKDLQIEGFQVQAGVGVKADAGVASFSVAQKTRFKILDGKGQFVPLMEQAVTKAREHQAQERNLQVRQLLRR